MKKQMMIFFMAGVTTSTTAMTNVVDSNKVSKTGLNEVSKDGGTTMDGTTCVDNAGPVLGPQRGFVGPFHIQKQRQHWFRIDSHNTFSTVPITTDDTNNEGGKPRKCS